MSRIIYLFLRMIIRLCVSVGSRATELLVSSYSSHSRKVLNKGAPVLCVYLRWVSIVIFTLTSSNRSDIRQLRNEGFETEEFKVLLACALTPQGSIYMSIVDLLSTKISISSREAYCLTGNMLPHR